VAVQADRSPPDIGEGLSDLLEIRDGDDLGVVLASVDSRLSQRSGSGFHAVRLPGGGSRRWSGVKYGGS